MKKNLISPLIVLVMALSGCTENISNELPAPFKVIPHPRNVEIFKGDGLEFCGLSGIELKGIEKRPPMGEILSQLPENNPSGKGALALILESTLPNMHDPEGYILTITKGSAEIKAIGESGIFYGCQTLEQLLEDARDYDVSIPSCIITDYPAIAYRSVHFDVKHHLDHMNYYLIVFNTIGARQTLE